MHVWRLFPVAIFLFAFAASVAIASAWTGPTASPPGGNVPAPINVGSSPQTKIGNLGIAQSAAPVFPLEVNGSSFINGALILYGASRYLNFGAASGAGGYGIRDNAGVIEYKNNLGAWTSFAASGVWATSGTNIYNTNTGNVGIGTTNPSQKLEVSGGVRINDRGDGCCSSLYMIQGGGNDTHLYSYANGDFQIHKYGAGSPAGAAFSITNAGNVGIGTANPGSKLHVNGGRSEFGSTGANYLPSAGNWNYTLLLDGLDTTSIGFHDSYASVSSIRYSNGGFVIGGDDGWGVRNVSMPGSASVGNTLTVNQGWSPAQAVSINSNQIWKSQTTGDPNLYLQWSVNGGNVYVGGQGGFTNHLYVSNGNVYANQFCVNGGSCIGGAGIGGAGTTNYLARFTPNGTTLGNSTITSDGLSSTANGNFLVTGTEYLTGNEVITTTAPTIYLADTDHRSAMIHNNSNLLYILRGCGVGSTSWCAYNGAWPLVINLENNDASFGGAISAATTVSSPRYCIGGSCITAWPTVSGTQGRIPRFATGSTLGDSSISSDGLSSTANGNFFVTGGLNAQGYAHFTGYGTDTWFPYTNGWNYIRGNTNIANVLYDEGDNGYYIDMNQTSNFKNLRFNGADCINGTCPPNQAIRMTPNFHLNAGDNYAVIVNWDNGTTGGQQSLRIGNGAGADASYFTANGQLIVGSKVQVPTLCLNGDCRSAWPVAASIGSGTAGRISRWVTATTLGDSSISSDGISSTANGNFLVTGTEYLTGNEVITNTSPTIYLADTDHRSAMIHNNSSLFYILRGCGNGSTSWCAYNGAWPLVINLENNDASFGGAVSATGAMYTNDYFRVNGNGGLYWQNWGGGWYMSDATWVRSYNNKSVFTGGQMRADGGFCIGASCITGWGLPLAGGTMNSGAIIDNAGRMHIASTEDIYLLARNGTTYVSSAWGGAGNLSVSGNAYASAFIYSSDARLKKDITPLSGNLAKVLRLNPVSYWWKDPSKQPTGSQIGFIAQDVEQVAPEIVYTDDAGMKSIDYARMTPLLVGSVQELNAKIDAQQKEIDELKNQMQAIKNRE